MRRLAYATALDLIRRPSTRLSMIAAAVLVALLPLVPAPGASVRDHARLTLELGATTTVLFAQTLAAAAAVAAAQSDADRGASPEMTALPTSPLRYFVARGLGIAAVGALALLAGALAALVTWPMAGVTLPSIAAMWPVIAVASLSIPTHAAFGLAAGRFLRHDAAYLAAVVVPWLPVGVAMLGGSDVLIGISQGTVPPATGLLHPRGLAFLQPVPLAALPWRIGASLLQAAAWTALCAASAPRPPAQRTFTP